MKTEDAINAIAHAIRVARGVPELEELLLAKLVEVAREDRGFFRKMVAAVDSVHGGKKAKIPLSDWEKEQIADTFSLWRPNYQSNADTFRAMDDFFALGEKSIEAILTEYRKNNPHDPR